MRSLRLLLRSLRLSPFTASPLTGTANPPAAGREGAKCARKTSHSKITFCFHQTSIVLTAFVLQSELRGFLYFCTMLNWISIALLTTITGWMAPNKAHAPHEVYVTMAQMEYNAEAHSIEVALKLFTDDTDRTVGRYFRENLNLGEPDEHPQADSLLMNYIQKKLVLTCDDEVLKPRFYGKEVSVEETWCYFDYPLGCDQGSTIEVENRIFIEVFDAQVNIMKFSASGGEDQSLQLGSERTTGSFQLP